MAYHIIGDADTVLGFRFAGVTGDVVEDVEQARAAFAKAIENHEPGILLEAEVTAHRLESTPPYLAVIPDIWGHGQKRRSLQEMISDAVGIKIVESDK